MADEKPIGLFTEASINGYRDVHDYYEVIRQQIILGDQLGFDLFTTTQSWGLDWEDSTFSVTPDPLALFASCAPMTKRIKLMSGIIPAAFHHPAIVISSHAALDQISNGRVMLGFGRGHPWLFDRLGLSQDISRDALEDVLMFTRRILDNQGARHTFAGKLWSVDDFQLLPRFIQDQPEVLVAVTGSPQSADEAAKYRCGIVVPAYVGLPMEMAEAGMQAYREAYRKHHGTEGKAILGIQLYADPDPKVAYEYGSLALAGQFSVFSRCMLEHSAKAGANYPAYKDIGGFMSLLSDVERCRTTISDEWPRYMAVWGDAEACIGKIQQLVDRLKPDGLIFNIDSGGISFEEIDRVMRYTGEAILPAVRKILASY